MAATVELSLTLDLMGNSLKNLFVWKYFLNWNQILVKWALDDLRSELYPMTLPANQDGHHSQIQSNIGPYGKFIIKFSPLNLLAQLKPNFENCLSVTVSEYPKNAN